MLIAVSVCNYSQYVDPVDRPTELTFHPEIIFYVEKIDGQRHSKLYIRYNKTLYWKNSKRTAVIQNHQIKSVKIGYFWIIFKITSIPGSQQKTFKIKRLYQGYIVPASIIFTFQQYHALFFASNSMTARTQRTWITNLLNSCSLILGFYQLDFTFTL